MLFYLEEGEEEEISITSHHKRTPPPPPAKKQPNLQTNINGKEEKNEDDNDMNRIIISMCLADVRHTLSFNLVTMKKIINKWREGQK